MLIYFSEENNASLSDTMKIGAFANNKKTEILNDNPDLIMPDAPFSKLLCDRVPSPVPTIESHTPPNNKNSDEKNGVKEDKNGNSEVIVKDPEGELPTSRITMVSTNDDFIMVDLVIFINN